MARAGSKLAVVGGLPPMLILATLAGLAFVATALWRSSPRRRRPPDMAAAEIGPTPLEVKRRSQANRALREDHATWTL